MFNRFNGDGWSLLYCDGKLTACGSRQYIDGYVSYVTMVQDILCVQVVRVQLD